MAFFNTPAIGTIRWRILVAEHDGPTRALLSAVLETPGRLVAVAADEAQARQLLQADAFDLVLLDDQLPDGSGVEFLPELKQLCPSAEVVVMTADTSVDTAVRGMQLGALDMLNKPVNDFGHLEAAASSALTRIELLREQRVLHDALARSEERYALVAQATNDGLWDWDLRTHHVYFSPRWLAMLGLTAGQVGDGPDSWLGRVHPDERPAVREALTALLQGDSDCMEVEYRVQHGDGSYRWVCTRGICQRDEAGEAYRMAGSQSDITQRKEAEQRLVHAALHDALTGLPNRALFLDRLEQCLLLSRRRGDQTFTVLFIDLDRFKPINDSLGHSAGDELLVTVAQRLRSELRGSDTLARLGGDELAVLLPDARGADTVFDVCQRLQTALQQPLVLCGQEVTPGASIGVAIGGPHYQSPDEILRDADTAMYHAKAEGGGAVRLFDSEMHTRAVHRLSLEADLRRALERGELDLHYQPIVDLATQDVVGCEALVRWRHPDRGMVPPSQFIPIAEETGLVQRIGSWTLREACARIAAWRLESGRDLFVSVNVSPRQFRSGNLVDEVRTVLFETGLEASGLKLEITEGVLVDDLQLASDTLHALREMGVRVCLDDFGTGYSSLSYLHRLPIDTVKVDRSFVAELGDQTQSTALIAAIIQMARALGIEVVAEGIEYEHHVDTLRGFDCDYGQGFFFAHPVPESRARQLLTDPPGSPSAYPTGRPPEFRVA